MISRLLLAACFTLIAVATQAQAYEPGWLVRSNGDTLRGEIENSFWIEPPTAIRYRPTATSPSELLAPRQLRAVSFTGGRYFRYEALPIDHGAETRPDLLRRGNQLMVKIDSILAEVLVEGPVTLLRVAQLGATHYFLLQAGQPVLALSERKYLHQLPNGGWGIVDGNNYRGQLGIYFRACPSAYAAVRTAPFTAKGLAAVVQAYNAACSAAPRLGQSWLKQATPRKRLAFQGGVLMGARYNRRESLNDDLTSFCSDCRVHPFGGLYMEVLKPGRAFGFYGELSVSTYRSRQTLYHSKFVSYDAQGQVTASVDSYSYYDYKAWMGTARMGMRGFLPLPHEQQLIFGLGYELFALWGSTPTSPTYVVSTGQLPVTPDNTLSLRIPLLMPNLTVGWRRQGFTASIDAQMYYDLDYPNSFIHHILSDNFSLRLGLGYRLGRNPDKLPARTAKP